MYAVNMFNSFLSMSAGKGATDMTRGFNYMHMRNFCK